MPERYPTEAGGGPRCYWILRSLQYLNPECLCRGSACTDKGRRELLRRLCSPTMVTGARLVYQPRYGDSRPKRGWLCMKPLTHRIAGHEAMCPEHILLQELLGVVRVRWQAATWRKLRDFVADHLLAALRDQVQLLSGKCLLARHVPRVMTRHTAVLRGCRRVLQLPPGRLLVLLMMIMKVHLLRLLPTSPRTRRRVPRWRLLLLLLLLHI